MDLDRLITLETAVWNALVDGDATADEAALSDDFLGVYPTGFATKADHCGQLGDGPTMARFAIGDARMFAVSDTAVMLSYRATFRAAPETASTIDEAMYVSSLWEWREDRWLNTFSQDTPTRV